MTERKHLQNTCGKKAPTEMNEGLSMLSVDPSTLTRILLSCYSSVTHGDGKVKRVLLLLLLLSRFSRVRLCATPQTAAHQAPPSLGFSRQEHWSRLPFPFPMRESEKWKWSRSVVSNSSRPHGLQPTRLLHPWDFPGKSTGVGCLLWKEFWAQHKCQIIR